MGFYIPTSSWLILITGKFFNWSSDAGGGPEFSSWFNSYFKLEINIYLLDTVIELKFIFINRDIFSKGSSIFDDLMGILLF